MAAAGTCNGSVVGGVRNLLRLEGAGLMAAAVWLYGHTTFGWGLFASLFLVPDLSFLGYLAGPRIGAVIYNGAHSTDGAIGLGVAGIALSQPAMIAISLIWLAHIGFDRALGFGLKYSVGFSATHLGPLGR